MTLKTLHLANEFVIHKSVCINSPQEVNVVKCRYCCTGVSDGIGLVENSTGLRL